MSETVQYVKHVLKRRLNKISFFFLLNRYKHTPLERPHTPLSCTVILVLLISVRNHTVHFIGQFVLKARNRLSGSASYQVSSSALHFVQAHVTGFSNLPLGKGYKLWIPGVDTEALRDQDLTLERKGMEKKIQCKS